MKKWPKTTKSWQSLAGSVLGTGWLPLAPGTWGAAVGSLLLVPFLGQSGTNIYPWLTAAILVFGWIGVRAARDLEPDWGEDPRQFVLDETVGLWIAMWLHPVSWWHLGLSFLLFRFFDILKPLGIRRLERYRGGWGVMLDDVGAGIAANVCLWLIVLLWK